MENNENEATETQSTFSKFTNKVKENRKPLLGLLLAGGAVAAAVKFLPDVVGNKYEKIGIKRMQAEGLYLGVSGNDLVFTDRSGAKVLYVVRDIEATDGGENIDWRTIVALDYCPEHNDGECIICVTDINGKEEERHFKYFLCERVK